MVEIAAEPADGLAMASGGDYGGIILDWTAPPAGWASRYARAAPGALLLVIYAAGDEGRHADMLKSGRRCLFRASPAVHRGGGAAGGPWRG
ncbi:MAG: hypothetical protein WDM92_00125 [Caulobacteraceae bacterium]